MEHGPLPPHEREWRHPSELAAEERASARAEALPVSSRVFALTTGTAGLVAIAVLFLLVTPQRQAQPVAVSASTSPAARSAPVDLDSAATIVAVRGSAADAAIESVSVEAALATPIGSGRFAVMLRASLGSGDGDEVDVVLPSGRVTSGSIVDDTADTGDAVLVQLDDHEPGHDVAEHRPHERDVVTLMASPPLKVALADLDDVDVADGTAVIDAEGHLVGLCTGRSNGGVRLVDVTSSVTAPADP